MASSNEKALKAIELISSLQHIEAFSEKINNKSLDESGWKNLPFEQSISEAGIKSRHDFLFTETGKKMDLLSGRKILLS